MIKTTFGKNLLQTRKDYHKIKSAYITYYKIMSIYYKIMYTHRYVLPSLKLNILGENQCFTYFATI